MASVDYSDLDRDGQRREGKSASTYDASIDVTNTTSSCVVGYSPQKIRLRAVYIVCTKAWAVGTSVAFTLGNATTAAAYASGTVTLAQMSVVGAAQALTLADTNVEVEAGYAMILTATKSGNMTGNYEVYYVYDYVAD